MRIPLLSVLLAGIGPEDPLPVQSRTDPEQFAAAVAAIRERMGALSGVVPTLEAEIVARLDVDPDADVEELREAVRLANEEISTIRDALLVVEKRELVRPLRVATSKGRPCPKDPEHPRSRGRYCGTCGARVEPKQ